MSATSCNILTLVTTFHRRIVTDIIDNSNNFDTFISTTYRKIAARQFSYTASPIKEVPLATSYIRLPPDPLSSPSPVHCSLEEFIPIDDLDLIDYQLIESHSLINCEAVNSLQLGDIATLPKLQPIPFEVTKISIVKQLELVKLFIQELSIIQPDKKYIGNTILLPIQTSARWIPMDNFDQCCLCQSVFGFFGKKSNCRICGTVICTNCCGTRVAPIYGYVTPVTACNNCHQSFGRIMCNLLVSEYYSTKNVKYLIVALHLGLTIDSIVIILDKLFLSHHYRAIMDIVYNISSPKVAGRLEKYIRKSIEDKFYHLAYTFGLVISELYPTEYIGATTNISDIIFKIVTKSVDFAEFIPLNDENIKCAIVYSIMDSGPRKEIYDYLLNHREYEALYQLGYNQLDEVPSLFAKVIQYPGRETAFLIYQLKKCRNIGSYFLELVRVHGSVAYQLFHHYLTADLSEYYAAITDEQTIYAILVAENNHDVFFMAKRYRPVLKYLLWRQNYSQLQKYVFDLIAQSEFPTATLYLYYLIINGYEIHNTLKILLTITDCDWDSKITFLYSQGQRELFAELIRYHTYRPDEFLLEKKHREWLSSLFQEQNDPILFSLYVRELRQIYEEQQEDKLIKFLTSGRQPMIAAVISEVISEENFIYCLAQTYIKPDTIDNLVIKFPHKVATIVQFAALLVPVDLNKYLRQILTGPQIRVPRQIVNHIPQLMYLQQMEATITDNFQYFDLLTASNMTYCIAAYFLITAKCFAATRPYIYSSYLIVRELVLALISFSGTHFNPLLELYYLLQCFEIVAHARKNGYNDEILNDVSDKLFPRINLLGQQVPFIPQCNLSGIDTIHYSMLLNKIAIKL